MNKFIKRSKIFNSTRGKGGLEFPSGTGNLRGVRCLSLNSLRGIVKGLQWARKNTNRRYNLYETTV